MCSSLIVYAGDSESGYNSKNIFSPRGRLQQAEYVQRIVDRGPTCIGACSADGIVFVVEREVPRHEAILGNPSYSSRLYKVDGHTAMAVGGYSADGKDIADWAAEECRKYHSRYGESISGGTLAKRLAQHVHASTRSWNRRTWACSIIVASFEGDNGSEKAKLYLVKPDGSFDRHIACAIGRGADVVTSHLANASIVWPGESHDEQGDSMDLVLSSMREALEAAEMKKEIDGEGSEQLRVDHDETLHRVMDIGKLRLVSGKQDPAVLLDLTWHGSDDPHVEWVKSTIAT